MTKPTRWFRSSESRRKNIILSLSSGGKVREFELRYRVAYRLTDRAGTDLASPGEIVLRRDMTYDDTVVLAKESEEAAAVSRHADRRGAADAAAALGGETRDLGKL